MGAGGPWHLLISMQTPERGLENPPLEKYANVSIFQSGLKGKYRETL